MKKLSKIIFLFFFFFLFSTKAYAYSDDYVISKYDVNINVNENNSFDITEKITVDFKNEGKWIVDETMFWILRTYIRLRHRSFAEKVVHDV